MSVTPASLDELNCMAALGQFHAVFSLVFLSQCFFIMSPHGSRCHVFNTCLPSAQELT